MISDDLFIGNVSTIKGEMTGTAVLDMIVAIIHIIISHLLLAH